MALGSVKQDDGEDIVVGRIRQCLSRLCIKYCIVNHGTIHYFLYLVSAFKCYPKMLWERL